MAWLSRMTGKPYRLLSEASGNMPREGSPLSMRRIQSTFGRRRQGYLRARQPRRPVLSKAGYQGDIADCDDKFPSTAPVGQFPAIPSAFTIWRAMSGSGLKTAFMIITPIIPLLMDRIGKAGIKRDAFCAAAPGTNPQNLRAARRGRNYSEFRFHVIGFRVARTLLPSIFTSLLLGTMRSPQSRTSCPAKGGPLFL